MRLRVVSFLVVIGLLAPTAPAHALSILGIYNGTYSGPDGLAANGGGNIQDIFEAAADQWEQAILDDVTVTIPYGWDPGSGLLGYFDGTSINFPAINPWFLDATPDAHDEFTTATSVLAYLDGTPVNYAVGFTGGTGIAETSYDLFSVMLHEIGHALTFSKSLTDPFLDYADLDVDVTAPRPLAGLQIPVPTGCCHVGVPAGYTGLHPLMFPTFNMGERRLISAVDLLLVAQGGQFTQLDQSRFVAPEPSTLALFGVAAIGFSRRRRLRG